MLSFSEDELKNKPEVHAGDTFLHKECGKLHELQAALSSGEPDESILWFQCGSHTILAALDNKWLW